MNSNIKVFSNRKHSIISCGVDLNTFFPIDKNECREKLNLSKERKLVLFGTSFDYGVRKNYKLAVNAIANIENVELLEIKNEILFLLYNEKYYYKFPCYKQPQI